ncbi:MAG: hypothetical protein NT073_31805, partial [Spirosoma sp.]|nr:hypothetical protein [Spirosoma sp.]
MALPVRIFILLLISLLCISKPSQGQVTIVSVSPTPVCAGAQITASYSTASSGSKTLTLFLYRSGAADSTQLTQITTNNISGTIDAIIPSNTIGGSYTVRIKQLITSPTTSTAISPKSPVFTINAIPTPPSVSNITYCTGTSAVPLSATASPGGTVLWYTSALDNQSYSAITPSTTTPGATTYYASQLVNNCESTRQSMTVTVLARPSAPLVSSNSVTYCQGAATLPLSATLSGSGGTLNWYGPTGNVLAGAPTPSSSATGSLDYSVSQTNNGCESDKVTITVTINAKPALPTVTPLNVCQNTPPVSLASSVSAVGTLKWYADASTTTFSLVAPTPPTTTAGITIYYVSQTDGNGCESDREPLKFTVFALPAAPAVSPTPVTYCQDVTAVPLVATAAPGGTLNWYDVATGGTSVASLIPSTAASANYYVSQTVNGCEGPRATINVIINAKPARPAVTTPVAYCQQATASPLSATAGAGNSLRWYGTAVTL